MPLPTCDFPRCLKSGMCDKFGLEQHEIKKCKSSNEWRVHFWKKRRIVRTANTVRPAKGAMRPMVPVVDIPTPVNRHKRCAFLDVQTKYGVAKCNCASGRAYINGCEIMGRCTTKINYEYLPSCKTCRSYTPNHDLWVDYPELDSLEDYFDVLYVINLDRRRDRWNAIEPVVNVKGMPPVVRVAAVDGSKLDSVPEGWSAGKGAYGCYLSHRHILEQSVKQGHKRFMVFEDDAVLADDFQAKTVAAVRNLPNSWGMFYLGGQHLKQAISPIPYAENLVVPFNVNRTHAMAFQSWFVPIVLKHLDRPFLNKAHIDHHLGRLHQTRIHPIYAASPWLVGQAAGKSNIKGEHVPERGIDGQGWK